MKLIKLIVDKLPKNCDDCYFSNGATDNDNWECYVCDSEIGVFSCPLEEVNKNE